MVSSKGTLVVHEVSCDTSKLHLKDKPLDISTGEPAFALQTRKGDHERIRIAVSNSVGIKKELLARNLPEVILLNEGKAADFLQSLPSISLQEVVNLLQHAAEFHFHLDRSFKPTSDREVRLADYIKIALVPVTRILDGPIKWVSKKVDGKDPDINREGLVKVLVGDQARYGINISNQSHLKVYLSLLYFNQSNFRIKSLYNSATAKDRTTAPPCLETNESLELGYNHPGEIAFDFTFSEDPSQQTEVGFLKLFISTSSALDLRGVEQESFLKGFKSRQLRDLTQPEEPDWDTRTITIVQRRK